MYPYIWFWKNPRAMGYLIKDNGTWIFLNIYIWIWIYAKNIYATIDH